MNWIAIGWNWVKGTAKDLFTKTGMIERDAVIRTSVYFVAAYVFTLFMFPGLQQYFAFLIALVLIVQVHVVMIWLSLKKVTMIQGPERARPASGKPELVTR